VQLLCVENRLSAAAGEERTNRGRFRSIGESRRPKYPVPLRERGEESAVRGSQISVLRATLRPGDAARLLPVFSVEDNFSQPDNPERISRGYGAV
jgi:hypothetical protein